MLFGTPGRTMPRCRLSARWVPDRTRRGKLVCAWRTADPTAPSNDEFRAVTAIRVPRAIRLTGTHLPASGTVLRAMTSQVSFSR
ncbi:hypothetical protein [Streptoalloteichus hindustanus]|uniref:Uncharacterized protein n=1 Tax=Streptoalloteichus hindustanus TaxID=2017 RepID=A0A1M5D2U0_STRHI|nr:hypothetical protein [Streptoalloteichus hindustanus]SHF61286.1 hypothetical protein SAMN05444320_104276 [Streptoalloteichus hindustanus]